MSPLHKIKASTKLYLLAFIMSGFIAGIGCYGIYEVKKMNRNTQTLYADRVLPIEQLTRVNFEYAVGILSTIQQLSNHHITFSTAGARIQEAENVIAANWNSYLRTYLTPEEIRLTQQAALHMEQTKSAIEKLKAILKAKDHAALDHTIKAKLYPLINPLIAKMNELVKLQIKVSQEIYKNSSEANAIALKRLYALILLSLIFAIPFSFFLVRNIKDLISNLHKSENKYRTIFENVQDAFFQTNVSGTILEVSPSIKNHLGYTREALIGTNVSDLYYVKADRENVLGLLREKGEIKNYELRFTSNTGELVYVSLNALLIRHADGSPSHLDGVLGNITERKKATELFKYQFENSPDIILVINKQSEIETINRGVPGGMQPAELIGKNLVDIMLDESKQVTLDAIRDCFKTLQYQEVELALRFGIWVRARLVPIMTEGMASHLMIFATDNTKRKKAELELENTLQELENRVIERTKELSEKNRNILDSITYAKRIQEAKLPKKEEVCAALPNCFVLFKPKDIVSGDFYFFHKNNNRSIFIAAADCTGHGVPGALMSMLGSEKLNDATTQSHNTSEILNLLNKGIKTSLRQSDSDESTRDGLDIALCCLDLENRMVQYAGANRPLWIVRKGTEQVEEISATKKAIGGLTEDSQHFSTHEIRLSPGDTIYITTDGYADQFGGKKGKKLMTKKFKEILLKIQDLSMAAQEKYLNDFIQNWKQEIEQVDDILVIGVRL
jgi:PAS domain S-box-containing protein